MANSVNDVRHKLSEVVFLTLLILLIPLELFFLLKLSLFVILFVVLLDDSLHCFPVRHLIEFDKAEEVVNAGGDIFRLSASVDVRKKASIENEVTQQSLHREVVREAR